MQSTKPAISIFVRSYTICNKVFKNEPSKNCRRQPFKNFKWHGLPVHSWIHCPISHSLWLNSWKKLLKLLKIFQEKKIWIQFLWRHDTCNWPTPNNFLKIIYSIETDLKFKLRAKNRHLVKNSHMWIDSIPAEAAVRRYSSK